jgi:hypothetical protein
VGVRAVIVVADDTGQDRRFWAPWASKQYQIPHLARFIHTADRDGIPLSVAGYLAYAATHPGSLPAQDITDQGWYTNPDEVGDLDHRYQLLLCPPQRTFRYLVEDRDRYRDRPGWRRSEDLGTRAQLYDAAARMCRDLAASTQRYTDRNNGVIPPGWPRPQDWRDQQHQFTQWLADTDPQVLHRPGPAMQPVPQWYAVRAARAQAKRINTRLREAYPGAGIRTRVSADATVSLTVPAALATDTEAAKIAQTLSNLLGATFTVSVRPHRPSRHTVHSGQQESRTRVNATLTLRPLDHPTAPDPTQPGAHADHASQ